MDRSAISITEAEKQAIADLIRSTVTAVLDRVNQAGLSQEERWHTFYELLDFVENCTSLVDLLLPEEASVVMQKEEKDYGRAVLSLRH